MQSTAFHTNMYHYQIIELINFRDIWVHSSATGVQLCMSVTVLVIREFFLYEVFSYGTMDSSRKLSKVEQDHNPWHSGTHVRQ